MKRLTFLIQNKNKKHTKERNGTHMPRKHQIATTIKNDRKQKRTKQNKKNHKTQNTITVFNHIIVSTPYYYYYYYRFILVIIVSPIVYTSMDMPCILVQLV